MALDSFIYNNHQFQKKQFYMVFYELRRGITKVINL